MAKKREPKKPFNKEAHDQMMRDGELRDIRERLVWGILPLNPTRVFAVGQRVVLGNLGETYVREVYEGGLYYLIESLNVQRERNKPAENEKRLVEWHEIFAYGGNQPTCFRKEEQYRIRFSNSGISSLLNMVYHFGVDFDVDYQRDHVWTLEDKVDLIDSIYNNVDIGKFVFVERSLGVRTKLFEIIDGKQRLTAICEFYEDRFQYKGYYFSQLSMNDQYKLTGHGISYGYLENPTKRAVYETFIKLNTAGRPMENKDIEKVKKLLDELK
jgi:hypothetical protein